MINYYIQCARIICFAEETKSGKTDLLNYWIHNNFVFLFIVMPSCFSFLFPFLKYILLYIIYNQLYIIFIASYMVVFHSKLKDVSPKQLRFTRINFFIEPYFLDINRRRKICEQSTDYSRNKILLWGYKSSWQKGTQVSDKYYFVLLILLGFETNILKNSEGMTAKYNSLISIFSSLFCTVHFINLYIGTLDILGASSLSFQSLLKEIGIYKIMRQELIMKMRIMAVRSTTNFRTA